MLAVDLGNGESLQVMLIDLQSATGQQSVDGLGDREGGARRLMTAGPADASARQ